MPKLHQKNQNGQSIRNKTLTRLSETKQQSNSRYVYSSHCLANILIAFPICRWRDRSTHDLLKWLLWSCYESFMLFTVFIAQFRSEWLDCKTYTYVLILDIIVLNIRALQHFCCIYVKLVHVCFRRLNIGKLCKVTVECIIFLHIHINNGKVCL